MSKEKKERKVFAGFDADARAAERASAAITIGKKVFHARKKTGEVIKGVILSAPEPTEPEFVLVEGEVVRDENNRPLEKPRPRTESADSIDFVYQQVAQLLEEEGFTGEHTQAKLDARAMFLQKHLDINDAKDLMGELMPQDEGDDEGN